MACIHVYEQQSQLCPIDFLRFWRRHRYRIATKFDQGHSVNKSKVSSYGCNKFRLINTNLHNRTTILQLIVLNIKMLLVNTRMCVGEVKLIFTVSILVI